MEMRYGAKTHLVSLVNGQILLLIILFWFLTSGLYGAPPTGWPNDRQTIAEWTVYNLLQTCGGGNGYERAYWASCLVEGHCDTPDKFWEIVNGDGKLTEYDDGTADLQMTIANLSNADLKFEISGTFTGRTYGTPAGSPKEGLCVGNVDNSDWYYYTGFAAEMIGKGALTGARITLERTGPAFQIGTGAGLTNMAYGGATWLNYTVVEQPDNSNYHLKKKSGMDFNFGLESACPVEIEKVILYRMHNGAQQAVLEEGGTYHLDHLPDNFGIKTIIEGNAGSVCYEVNGHELNDNNAPYTYPGPGQAWNPAPGTYEVVVKAYTIVDKEGILCDERNFSIEILDCDNVTNGGRIGHDQTACSTWYDPSEIVSLRDPSGGSGEIEFLWLKSTVTCNPPTSLNDPNWTIIEEADGPSYDPGPIMESTCFLRCSRRIGCDRYLGESNIIRIELEDGPEVAVLAADPECSEQSGSISFSFPDHPHYEGIQFSMDGGESFPLAVKDDAGTAVFTGMGAGKYQLAARWSTEECAVDLGEVNLRSTAAPQAETTLQHPTCGKKNGMVTFYFRDMPGRTNIEFSKDGGKTFPLNVRDHKGTASFKWLRPGSYHLFVRWGNNDCPVDLGTVELVNESTPLSSAGRLSGKEKNCGAYDPDMIKGTQAEGGHGGAVIYQWQRKTSNGAWQVIAGANGRDYDPEIIDVTTNFRRRARLGNDCGNWKYSNVITKIVTDPPAAEVHVHHPTCGEKNGKITFTFRDHARRTHISFSKNGGESYQKTVRDNSGSATFNGLPPGEYHLKVRWGNRECPVDLGTVTLENQGEALTDGGTIGDHDRHCGPYITGMIAGDVPQGANGQKILYQWQRKTAGNWEDIEGANQKDYAGEFIAVSTWYRRLAKLENECDSWRASNTIDRHVLTSPDAKVFTVDPTCGKKNGEIIFSFANTDGRTNIEFSKDGGATFPLNVRDHKGVAKFRNLRAGLYHLYVRWGNDECPVELGTIELIETSSPLSDAGKISGNERACGPYDATMITGTEASGGFGGEVLYQWQQKTTGSWEDITGATAKDYDPGMIYQSTWFRRRAKRNNGCGYWRSSNSVDRHVIPAPEAEISTTGPDCGEENGSITFTFPDFQGRTHLEFSRDGGDRYELRTEDKVGSATFTGLSAGSHHLFMRWGNDDCPVDLGIVTLNPPAGPFYPAQPGTPCNDGNDGTVDDVVQEDGCTCLGSVPACEVEACVLTLDQEPVFYICEHEGETTVSASVADPGMVPPGHEVVYLLTEGPNRRIEAVANEASFTFNTPKGPLTCWIQCFVFDPEVFDLNRIQPFQTTIGDLQHFILTEELCADVEEEGVPFEFVQCAGLGNLVWEDIDLDGIQDPNEPGLAGVTVYAMGDYGKAIFETQTNANGRYGFGALRPGDYLLQFVAPDGYAGSPRDMGDDDEIDSDAGFNTGMTGYVTLAPGEYNATIDAGFYDESTCNAYCELQLVTPAEIYLCEMNSPSATVTASSVGNDIVPAGYRVKYILSEGDALLIEKLADVPSFDVPKPEPGVCRMHCLVYNPDPESDDYFDVSLLKIPRQSF